MNFKKGIIENSLQKLTLTSLIKYTFPTIVMMVLFSCYTIIDRIDINDKLDFPVVFFNPTDTEEDMTRGF